MSIRRRLVAGLLAVMVSGCGGTTEGRAPTNPVVLASSENALVSYRSSASQLASKFADSAAAMAAAGPSSAGFATLAGRAFADWAALAPLVDGLPELRDAIEGTQAVPSGWMALTKGFASGEIASTQPVVAKLATDAKRFAAAVGGSPLSADVVSLGCLETSERAARSARPEPEGQIWSSLWAVSGYVHGSEVCHRAVAEDSRTKDARLEVDIDNRFTTLRAWFDTHRKGDSFDRIDGLDREDLARLQASIAALSEVLAEVGAVIHK